MAALKPSKLHVDGELVAMDPQGRPSFQSLQGRGALPNAWRFGLYVFDLLSIGGHDLREERLLERRTRLVDLVTGHILRFSPTLEGTAKTVTRAVRQQGLEGVVAKWVDSRYEPGQRSGAWMKLPLRQRGLFAIGGYRPSQHGVGVLLVGHERQGRFVFAGKVRYGL